MGYVNWKECLYLYVHYIYDVVVSLCFYNTSPYILSFQLFTNTTATRMLRHFQR
jgi:hypothetical protein